MVESQAQYDHSKVAMAKSSNRERKSPTQRSVQKLHTDQYQLVWITEFFAYGKRHDLFGFGDILALKKGEILLVQTTTYSNVSARVKKITEHENVGHVRDAGIRIVVHGWHKKNDAWICREVDLS